MNYQHPGSRSSDSLFTQAVAAGKRRSRIVRWVRIVLVALLIGGTVVWRYNVSADETGVPDNTNLPSFGLAGFMQTTVVNPATIAPHAPTTITTAVMAMQRGLVNGIIDIEVYNAANQKVGQQYFTGQNIGTNQTVTQTYRWSTSTPGPYRVAVGVFGPNWRPLYLWVNNAAGITVSTAQDTETATPSNTAPASSTAVPPSSTNTPVPPSATSTFTPVPPTGTNSPVPTSATNTQPPSATGTPNAPTATPTNTPVVPTGTGTVGVSAPTFTQATTAQPTGSGAAYSISTTVKDMSGTLQNGIIDIEVYNASYQKVGQQFFTGQNLGAGQNAIHTITWTAPVSGAYQVAVGVFSSTWRQNYLWVIPAVTINYGGSAATSTTTPTPTDTLTLVPPSATASATGTVDPPSQTPTMTPISATRTDTPVAPTATNTATGNQGSGTVPVPTNLAAAPDDRAAVLTWNADMTPASSDPPGVHGYKITWGPQSNPTEFTALTMYRIIELQPLVNGQPYVATVQAIDNDGDLSASSTPLTLTGDSSRVDALRQQMTGFFDDFNDPALSMKAPNSLKWNTAVSQCNDDPTTEGMFLNEQSHVHNLLDDNNCDRGQNVSRPRATFDFTGRTGTITFDLDGFQRRDIWYLDLVPRLMDIDGDVQLEGQPSASGTANSLRFKQTGQSVSVCYIDGSGNETCPSNTALGSYDGKIAWDNLTLVTNVRRHWTLHVSQHHADIFVNGIEEYATDALNLPFSKATVLWDAFSYNTRKSNEDRTLLHWDNLGFDGPAPTVETHNYVAPGCCGGGDYSALQGTPVTKTIQIPDSLTGETAERLMFTMQMDQNNQYAWNSADQITVNGYTCPVAQPGPSTIPQASLVSTITPYGVVCNLPLGTLHTGANTVVFSMASSGVLDVHAEVDYPAGQAPAYTQPALAGMPMNLPDIGPGATIDQVGTCSDTSCYTWAQEHGPFTVSGIVPIQWHVQEEAALHGIGKIPGIREVEMTLDGQVLFDRRTDAQVPAPAVYDTFNLDTTKLSNGTHQLRLLAWNANGTASIPDYFQAESSEGTDWPIAIQVSN